MTRLQSNHETFGGYEIQTKLNSLLSLAFPSLRESVKRSLTRLRDFGDSNFEILSKNTLFLRDGPSQEGQMTSIIKIVKV